MTSLDISKLVEAVENLKFIHKQQIRDQEIQLRHKDYSVINLSEDSQQEVKVPVNIESAEGEPVAQALNFTKTTESISFVNDDQTLVRKKKEKKIT